MTFFPWAGIPRGRPGSGQSYATGFSIPAGSLPFWQKRFVDLKIETASLATDTVTVVIEHVPGTSDPNCGPLGCPDGTSLAHGSASITKTLALVHFTLATPLAVTAGELTALVLTETMGYRLVAQSGHRTRYAADSGGPGTYVDLLTDPALPRGVNGAGTIHHVAFRVPDDATQEAARAELLKSGLQVEIATDQPGFAIDEPVETLGEKLSLPPRLEPHRAEIEAALPKLNRT